MYTHTHSHKQRERENENGRERFTIKETRKEKKMKGRKK
jgi:hypothetical protein